jgi:serine phosphatase RsbU (regulator of sigma subunit)/CHASE2 domain-containing sensor protein
LKALIDAFQSLFLARRGRPAALAILLTLVAANWLSEIPAPGQQGVLTALRSAIATPFVTGRQLLFDSYQRLAPRVRTTQPVTIVEIDEQSLKQVGQWPWPRNRLATLIDAIAVHQPAAIGLDMYMPEIDQTSPPRVAANLPPEQARLARALADLPSHEAELARALRAAPTVLGAAGFDFATFTTTSGLRTAPIAVAGGDPLPHLRRFPQVLASLPELQTAAHGQALLSVDYEGAVVRRMPLVMAVGEQVVPSLPMELLRVASGADAIRVAVDRHGIARVGVAELDVATQPSGEIWLHFARRADASPREISAADVLAGKVPEDMLAGKVVLIGLTGSGLSDMRVTPLRELVPGIEIQAQALEGLLEGDILLRPFWMKPLELGLLLGLGLLMVWLIPHRAGRIARTLTSSPKAPSWVVMGLNAVFLVAGYALFRSGGLIFDAASLLIGFSAVLGSLVSSAVLEIERENARLAQEQQRMREEAARVSGELAAARRIQLGSLPDARLMFGAETRFEIATVLEPAREVGGDLYDFFMIDARRLCFAVGDVSGKGVPASLFMAVTRALAKGFSLRLDAGPAAVVAAANEELARENSELLFVTFLLGVLDIDSGRLELVNAGHDAPWRIGAAGGAPVQLLPSADTGGPPLCMVDSYPYAVQVETLAPGDTLCMITDGVTEAMNAAGELYGAARLEARLATIGPALPLEQVAAELRADVARHVAGAEPSDDLTLLLLRWNGPAAPVSAR